MKEANTIHLTATIASGESISSSIDMSAFALGKDNYRLHAIDWPSNLDAANFSFETSRDDGVTWRRIIEANGNEAFVVPVAGEETVLIPEALKSVSLIRLCSGSKASPVNQSSNRTFTLIVGLAI